MKTEKKQTRISARCSVELKERLQRAVETTGLDEAALVKNALEALLKHYESTGELTFPLRMVKPADPVAQRLGEITAGARRAVLANSSARNYPPTPESEGWRLNEATTPAPTPAPAPASTPQPPPPARRGRKAAMK